ncbi:MAG: hypothetical protein LBS05_04085, partial [Tannerellaceae bacterium]|nr:hypothetical protein [Tannerellaceae bacterium]
GHMAIRKEQRCKGAGYNPRLYYYNGQQGVKEPLLASFLLFLLLSSSSLSAKIFSPSIHFSSSMQKTS